MARRAELPRGAGGTPFVQAMLSDCAISRVGRALLAVLCGAICWSPPAGAGPATLGEVQGQAASVFADGHLGITAADHAILRWDHLSIERGAVVDITLPDPSSRVLILVTGSRPADIAGRLVSNGHVYLVAPLGVEIHSRALVRSGGLWVSTMPISEVAFSRGEAVEFIGEAAPEARIVHAGAIESRRQAGGRADDRSAATIGGPVVLISKRIDVRDGAVIDASGELGGGSIAIGGGKRGDDPRLTNADVVSVGKGARILADAAREGSGGDVVVWAEQRTTFLGAISATGGAVNGNGGNAEISSKGTLVFDGHATLSSAAGSPGRLLIDPASITIQAAGPDIDGLGLGHDITSTNELASAATFPGVDSIITAAALNGLLTGGVSMTLAASGIITVNAPVAASGPVTLLVLDAPTVNLNRPIALPSGGALAGMAATVNVGPLGKIQNGVDAAAAGATVTLAAATYVQEVKITKSLVLQGQGAASTSIVSPPMLFTNTFVYTINGATYHPIVLVEGASPVTIQQLTVDGNPQLSNFLNNLFVGIGYHNAGGTIQDVIVTRIEDESPGGPTQHGFAIFGAIDDGTPHTIQVLNNQIDRFQKQGITMRGPTLTAVISSNTVTGETPPSRATVNGIVIRELATASISNNTVTNIISATAGVDSVAIFPFPAGSGSSVTNNMIADTNIGIVSVGTGGNLIISGNTISGSTHESIAVQDTNGLTTLTGNTMSCGGLPSGSPTVNMELFSTANQPFVLANNQFNGCDVGLLVEGGGQTGPLVTMDHDAFVGTGGNYIELASAPNDIWPSTQTVSFDGLVSGQITFAQFNQLLTRIVDKHNDPALGLVLDFIAPTAQLRIAKAALPASFAVGVPGSYDLTVTNTGIVPTTAVATVTDDIPASLILGALPAGCTASGHQVSCSIAAGFPAQGAATFLIPITPTVGGAAVNTAKVSGGGDLGCPQETARCEATITTSITTTPQLRVSKQATPASFATGVQASYTLTVVNEGTGATTAITTVMDSVTGTLTLGTMPAGCTVNAQEVICTIPAGFATGATATFVIPVTPTVVGSVVNTARVSGGGDVGCPQATGRCEATITTAVAGLPQLRLTKHATPPTFAVGVAASYTLTVINEGMGPTTAITEVVDNVPAGLTVGAMPAGCTVSSQQVTCTIPAGLAAGATASFILPVTLTGGGQSVTNTATLAGGGDAGCPGDTARCTARIVTVVGAPQLRVTKEAEPPTFVPGQPASYRLTVTNAGTVATTAPATLTDTVPDGLTLGSLPAGCTASGQAVTCTIAAGLAAGASVSFILPVVPGAQLAGTVQNTVTIFGGGDAGCPLEPRCRAQVDVVVGMPQAIPLSSPAMLIAIGMSLLLLAMARLRHQAGLGR